MVRAIIFVCVTALISTVVLCENPIDLCSSKATRTNGVVSNKGHPEYVEGESCKCDITSNVDTNVEIKVIFKRKNTNENAKSEIIVTLQNLKTYVISPDNSKNTSMSVTLTKNRTSSIALSTGNEEAVSYYITFKSQNGNLTFMCGGWTAHPIIADGLALYGDPYSSGSTGVLVGAIVGSLVGVGIFILILVCLAIKLGYCQCPGFQKEEQFDNPLANKDYPDRSKAVHVGKINNAYVGSPNSSSQNISGKNQFFSNSFEGQQNAAYDLSFDSSWDHSHNTTVTGILKNPNGGTPSDTSSDNDNKKKVNFAPMPEQEKKKKSKKPPKVNAFTARNFGIPQPKKRTRSRSPRRSRSPSPSRSSSRHSLRSQTSEDEVDRGAPPSKRRNQQPVEAQVQQQRNRPVESAPPQSSQRQSERGQPSSSRGHEKQPNSNRNPERQPSSSRNPERQPNSVQQPVQPAQQKSAPKSILRSPKQPKSASRPQSEPAYEKPFTFVDDDVIYADMSNYQDPYLLASKEALNTSATKSLPNISQKGNHYEPPPVKAPLPDHEPAQYRPRSNSQPSLLKNKGLAPSMGTYAPEKEALYALPKKGKNAGPNQPTHKRAPPKETAPPVRKQQPASPKENIYEELPDPDSLPPKRMQQPQYEDRPPSGIVLETPNGGTNRQSRPETRQSSRSPARTPSPKSYSPHMMVRLGLATPNESIETDI